MRDAEAHDSNFASFFWNNSQNASKEKHRAATPGVAGCISPGKCSVVVCCIGPFLNFCLHSSGGCSIRRWRVLVAGSWEGPIGLRKVVGAGHSLLPPCSW